MIPIASIKTPQESVNDEYLSLIKVHVTNGQAVSHATLLAEFETSKAVVELFCEYEGFIKVCCTEGTEVKVGTVLFEVYADANIPVTAGNKAVAAVDTVSIKDNAASNGQQVQAKAAINQRISQKALSLIEKDKVDISLLQHLNFVTTKDIEKLINPNKSAGANNIEKKAPLIKSNTSVVTSKKLSASKKREAEYLQSVNNNGVVSMLSVSVELAGISRLQSSQSFITTTPLPTVIFEVSRLLKKYPNLNSYFDNGCQNTYEAVNVGFAIDIDKELKVCAINDTDGLSIEKIEDQIADLTQKYSIDKLTKEELTSTTFTITDLFNSSITDFFPLVNINNSAILGISALQNNFFKINLSFDHRISSGKEVALFLNDLKMRLEAHFNSKSSSTATPKKVSCIKCLRQNNEDLNGSIYFVAAVNATEEGYICSNCLTGW